MRILIVEDERHLRETLVGIIQKCGYSVDTAADGERGLDCALSGIYDVILLDVMLPGFSGFELLRRLRGSGSAVPVLLLTARDEVEDKVHGLDCGADDYLTKPFSTEELCARVRALSRRQTALRPFDLARGNLTLSLQSATLSAASGSVALGPKELALLELLLRAEGTLVPKERIVEKVWVFDGEAEYNSVEVYISFLRKKLLFVGANCEIRARRGLGYYLEVTHD